MLAEEIKTFLRSQTGERLRILLRTKSGAREEMLRETEHLREEIDFIEQLLAARESEPVVVPMSSGVDAGASCEGPGLRGGLATKKATSTGRHAELQALHTKIYGGPWGKPKSTPYLLMKLGDLLWAYGRTVKYPRSSVIMLMSGYGPVTFAEVRRFVHLLCRLLVERARTDKELSTCFWEGRGRQVPFSVRKDFSKYRRMWEVFCKAAREGLQVIPPVLGTSDLGPSPEIRFMED